MSASTSKTLSVLAFAFGLLAVVLSLLFLFTLWGPVPLIAGTVAGLLGVVLGFIGAAREQAKAMSVTGIVLGGLVVLLALGLYIFAMVFLGVI